MVPLLVPLALVVAVLGVLPAPSAAARTTPKPPPTVPSFVCADNTVYSVDGDSGEITRLNPTTGATSANGDLGYFADGRYNALALPSGGGPYAYAFDRYYNKVLRYAAGSNDVDYFPGSADGKNRDVIAGAINPANGIYYYAANGSPWTLYAFDPGTQTAVGKVGTMAGSSGNGDFAFDAVGNLYVVSNPSTNDGDNAGTLTRFNDVPDDAGSGSLTGTVLTDDLPANSGAYAAMAFDGTGELIIGTGSGKVLRVDPSSGELLATKSVGLKLHDMASCSAPSTAAVRVDLPQGRYDTGDQFTVKITGNGVTTGNTGTTAGTDTGLQEQPAEVGGPVVVLPGQTYTLTQTAANGADLADYDTTWKCTESNGSPFANGTGSSGAFMVPPGSGKTVVCTFTNLPVRASLTLDKVAGAIADTNGSGRPDAGDRISYTFKVTNTGNVKLTSLAVSDTKVGPVTCPVTQLAAGASTTCTAAAYTLTQADVDAGKVVNTATATAKDPKDRPVTGTDTETKPVPQLPAIELVKTGALKPGGTVVGYTFTITNTGNVTLNPVNLVDPKVGPVTCPTAALAPQSPPRECTADYTVTQADLNAGKVDNTATVTGTKPGGGTVTDADSETVPLNGSPGIGLVKTSSAVTDTDGNGTDAGDKITYTLTVTNTGTQSLTGVTVTDPLLGGPQAGCAAATLEPGQSEQCQATYTLTQADLDAGTVANTATAAGTPPSGPGVTDTDSTTTPLPSSPAIKLTKTAGAIVDGDGNGPHAGDTITYSFKVTNTGNVTLNPVTVSDPKVGAVTCGTGALVPGDSRNCTDKSYALTQADVDAGVVANTATATGTPPVGPDVTDDDSTTTTVTGVAAIKLVKFAGSVIDLNGNGIDDGDQLVYSFKVSNTGAVTLTNVTVTDPKLGVVTCSSAPLAPGQSRDCDPLTYSLTQADVDAGEVENTAAVTGTTPTGGTVTDEDELLVDLPEVPARIQLVKSAGEVTDLDGNGADAGDTITYSFTVTNTGNTVLTDIEVSDPKVGEVTCPDDELAPDESMQCDDADYTLTAADIAAEEVSNTATVTGTTPDDDTVTDEDSTLTPIVATVADIKVKKTVDDATPQVGGTLTYTLTVTNNGPGVADDVVVTDALPSGVTFVSAEAPCTKTGTTVRCELGALAADESVALKIKVTVDPLPTLGTDHQHWVDVQKTEVHVDVLPGQQAVGTVACQPGYLVSDGSGRVDHVDQGTGTLADVVMTENRATNGNGWRATFESSATGRAQAKVFAVCLKQTTEEVGGHTHDLVLPAAAVTETAPLPIGRTDLTLTCAAGQVPVRPSWLLDGPARVLTTYPSGATGWTFGVVNAGGATTGTFSIGCLDVRLTTASGHTHSLALDEVRQTVTVPAGQVGEYTLTCANDAKGIVGGHDLDPGLVPLGNDPRPVVRVFKLFNPTAQPLDARLYLRCLGTRTEKGADPGGKIVNTASVTTATAESSTANNSDSVSVQVEPTVAAVAPQVEVHKAAVTAKVRCGAGGVCKGKASLLAASTTKVNGTVVKKGAVLAKTAYKIKGGKKVVLRLKATKIGRKALGRDGVHKAKLRIGDRTWVVRIKR
ncbi:DUF7507 domain-containing protein [Nocardioides ferulae]|uniref:DUF7507 domain-containing protein n=1 Tax=Nocardioides ferulae TaxID=2340821 RepID=UPI0013DE4083|nr:DUF11 domain-containing protein [Nocardioides ferulae]